MRHTVFKLTYNILSLFINVHHARAICDHVSSMKWSSFRDRCKPRLDKSGLEIFQGLACIDLESKFSRLRHLNFDPVHAATSFWNKTARFYAKNSVSVGICNLGRLIDFFLVIQFCNELVFIFDCSIQGVRSEILKGIFTEIIVVSQSVCELF
jgi:hypothetical protein